MTRQLEAVVYSSAREIASVGWPSLSATANAQHDPAWFGVTERAVANADPIYLCLQRNGVVEAVAPCLITVEDDMGFASYRATDVLLRPEEVRGPDVHGLDRDELNQAAVPLHALRPLRALSVVIPFSRYAAVGELISPGADAFERLVAELDAVALERGAVLWAILGVADDAPLLRIAPGLGLMPALLSADTVLHAPWSSFEDYVAALPSHRRTTVRKEVRAASERYTVAAERDVIAVFPELFRLTALQRAHYGTRGAVPLLVGELTHAFGRRATVLGARRDGRLIAYTVLLRRGDVTHALGYAADHDVREREDFLWANMAVYAPIREVVARGGGTLRLGATNYEAKLLRGCRLERMWGLYRPLDDSVAAALQRYLGPFNRLQEAHYDALERYVA